jgi:arylsulfatase A-like enzyme
MLYQFENELDEHTKCWRFNAQDSDPYDVFRNDIRMAYASLDDNLIQKGEGYDSSLFLGPLARIKTLADRRRVEEQKEADRYPRGLPQAPGLFYLDDLVDGSIEMLKEVQQPFLAYLHFWPPHHPYTPTTEYFDMFNDGWNPPDKPIHKLSDEKNDPEKLNLNRRYYDEFIASWDSETTRLYQYLEESGLRENSYIIITADHGELFERGKIGHGPKLIYDPVIHVPLIVSRPGQETREDVHALTSSVDVLPTIAHLTGNSIPAWTEGRLLPNLGGEADVRRSVFSIDARTSSSFAPLENFSISITREQHCLVFYRYPEMDYQEFEFYDLTTDPHELKNLYPSGPALARDMKEELLQKVEEFNQPYRRSSG